MIACGCDNPRRRRIAFTLSAQRDLAGLPADLREVMIALIAAYAAGETVDATAMRGRADHVRLKAGEHRAVVVRDRAMVTVLRVRHRDIVYRP